MSVLVKEPEGRILLFSKGADRLVPFILNFCSFY